MTDWLSNPPTILTNLLPKIGEKCSPKAKDIWCLIATHGLMHAGQFVPVRRALGKPVVI